MAQIVSLDTQREELRRRGVAGIMGAVGLESEMRQRAAETTLTQERALTEAAARQPHVNLLIQQARTSAAEADRIGADAASTRALLQPRIDQLKAAVRASDSEVDRNSALAKRTRDLLQYEINELEARTGAATEAQALHKAERSRLEQLTPSEVTYAEQRAKSWLPVTMSGEQFTLSGKDLVDYLQTQATQGEVNRRFNITAAGKTADDLRTEYNRAKEAEQKITSPGSYKGMTYERLTPIVDEFHHFSTDPYVYVYGKTPTGLFGLVGGTESYKRYQIPRLGNVQLTARDVYERATKLGMDVQNYMEKVFYPNLNAFYPNATPEQLTAPWLRGQ